MKKYSVKEAIVVEGIHDKQKVESSVNAHILVSSGTRVSKTFLDMCEALNKERGLIVFTDPDGPGEMIRRKIIERVGTCKHASLNLKQSKNKGKVGIEHASCADILEALEKCATFEVDGSSMTREQFNDLGLSGRSDSQLRRDVLSQHFSIPQMNAKRCFKYLNMMHITYDMAKEALEKGEAHGNNRK